MSSSCEEPTSMISVWLLSVQACCGGVRVVIITKGFGGCPVRSFGKSLAANKKRKQKVKQMKERKILICALMDTQMEWEYSVLKFGIGCNESKLQISEEKIKYEDRSDLKTV